MKRSLLLAPAFMLIISSCNNEEDKSAGETKAVAAAIPSVSFKVIMLQHPVKDFAAWKKEYLSHDSMRQVYGINHMLYGRALEDSNMAVVIDKITEGQKAKNFSLLPALKKSMKKAGVTAEPKVSFADVVRMDDSKIEQADRLIITHTVRDFNAWLKVYDAEGMIARREHGLIDRALARDMDNPDKVYIVFAISDMTKAKARMASEELKKIMTDAGVVGPPQLFYYRQVD